MREKRCPTLLWTTLLETLWQKNLLYREGQTVLQFQQAASKRPNKQTTGSCRYEDLVGRVKGKEWAYEADEMQKCQVARFNLLFALK